jgi:hypothetical protein
MVSNYKRIACLVLLLSLISPVFAAFGTHLNVSIKETVYQLTTFAENFTLDEWQKSCYSQGIINVSNPNTETVNDIYISFLNTAGLSTNFTWVPTTKFGNQTSGQPGQKIVINIPELRSGNYTIFTYNISCMGQNPPINIISNYTNTDHGFNRKVLAGYNWTVNQSARNDNIMNLNITNINITIRAANLTWNDTQFNFSLKDLFGVGDYANVHGNSTTELEWWWAPNGGELAKNQMMNISYNMQAPLAVPFTATYLAIIEQASYQVAYLLSNLTIQDINASAQVDLDLQKRISQPAENIQSHNVTWEVTPLVTVPLNITYNLSKVTLWVTRDMNPINKTNGTSWGLLERNFTGTPLQQINLTTSWGGSAARWYFNYTDGSNDTYPPPIIWIKPDFLITNQWGQILNYSQTVSGNDVYLKYIYVINGYWLEVQKNVTNIDENIYRIDTRVENVGNGWTPEYTYVTVYDYVPQAFGIWNMTNGGCPSTECTSLAVGTAGSEFYGTSYRWNIQWKGTMNSSLGPKLGPYATSWENYSWNVSYLVNGTGPYEVSELYIVGLDPLKVDGAYTSPIITIISGLQSHTNEIIYLSVIGFLIIVNITNLVITNRIHKKLSERLPPAPPAQNHQQHHQHPPQQ